jgi:tRNA(Ile2) C34 agmatinyltransferase TiaS
MTPLCPVCVQPMKKHGRAFQCERCRQIIVFFEVSDVSRYINDRTEPELPKKEN